MEKQKNKHTSSSVAVFLFLFVGVTSSGLLLGQFAFYAAFCVPSEFDYITFHAVGLKQALITHASSETVQLKPVGDTILKNPNLNCNLLLCHCHCVGKPPCLHNARLPILVRKELFATESLVAVPVAKLRRMSTVDNVSKFALRVYAATMCMGNNRQEMFNRHKN